jgi:hypothetical protein
MGMMDQTLVNGLLTNLYKTSTASVFTAGTGGATISIVLPFRLHLFSAAGSETGTGTELTTANGYTGGFNASGGVSLGTVFAGTVTGGSFTNANAATWSSITGAWATVLGVEVYDSTATAVRHLWGTVSAISGITTGDTVQFPASSITANASNW